MKPIDALALLGAKRVIWIDDHFEEATALALAGSLTVHLDTSRRAGLDQFEDIYLRVENGDDAAAGELAQHLANMSAAQRRVIARKFNAAAANAGSASDLSEDQISSVCEQLSIEKTDLWSFKEAPRKLKELVKTGDQDVGYIIDLNDAYGAPNNTEGLNILKELEAAKSKGTAFLLTHEATKKTEAEREREWRLKLNEDSRSDTPICVIAKERLEGDPLAETVAEGLRVAIKRAGLRRGVHQVLLTAKSEVAQAYEEAMTAMLQIPPEQLDHYVVGRAYGEGVSELHVVERALTASMSESFRRLFATGSLAIDSARKLRALRDVPLQAEVDARPSGLEEFRRKELWEPKELVNHSYSPLSCGDVFEVEGSAGGTEIRQKFILLAQPCDIMLRPTKGRISESGFLVPLKAVPATKTDSLRVQKLPFQLDGIQWACDFEQATPVNLSVLDLATLRQDGRVRYDEGQTIPEAVLPGQLKSGRALLERLKASLALQAKKNFGDKSVVDARCQLTFSAKGAFKNIAQGKTVAAIDAQGDQHAVPAHLAWGLARAGRIRMPYSAALLSNYLAILDREAFDLDYLKVEDAESCGPTCAAPTPASDDQPAASL